MRKTPMAPLRCIRDSEFEAYDINIGKNGTYRSQDKQFEIHRFAFETGIQDYWNRDVGKCRRHSLPLISLCWGLIINYCFSLCHLRKPPNESAMITDIPVFLSPNCWDQRDCHSWAICYKSTCRNCSRSWRNGRVPLHIP